MPGKTARRLRGGGAAALALLLSGCDFEPIISFFHLRSLVTFFTAGPVAGYERNLMLITFGVMLFVLIPVVVLTLWFAWRYRASNTNAKYWPKWHSSRFLEVFLWAGPIVIIMVLGTLTWISTHHLDPWKPLPTKSEPIRVQAVALDWKWLFIYPQYHVAAVNELAMPVNRPISMYLTSGTVMTALMIPRLGTQVFAMSGMRTQLHLAASKQGIYFGKNYQYSGNGFNNMTFHAIATGKQGFKQWLAKARSERRALSFDKYQKLALPSKNVPVRYYSSVEPRLFYKIIALFNRGQGHKPAVKRTASAAR